MIAHLEDFFNHQSDLFWAWRPVHRLRPPLDEPISAEKFLRRLPLLALGALAMVVLVFALGAAADAVTAGTLLSRAGALAFLNNLGVIFTVIGLRIIFLTIFVSYGLTLLTLPYLFFWNRRARRLYQEPRTPELPTDVWPPPPENPSRFA